MRRCLVAPFNLVNVVQKLLGHRTDHFIYKKVSIHSIYGSFDFEHTRLDNLGHLLDIVRCIQDFIELEPVLLQ